MKKFVFFFASLVIFLFAGCSTPATPSPDPATDETAQKADPSKPAFTGLNRDLLQSYSSTFLVRFDGPTPWTYQLKTRKSLSLREMNLHIEGIQKEANPGDIRLVTDGKTSWMIGPGTDQECVQFPNNQGMDPTLLSPETLVSQAELSGLLSFVSEDKEGETASLHFSGSASSAGGWKDVNLDVWQDKASQALLKFTMQASGEDPIFGAGSGKLTARYDVAGLGTAAIEPVKGCEINFSLPDTAINLVRLPGMASFESAAGVEEIIAYYQAQLPQENWTENEPPAQSESATVLSYRRNAEAVEIHIQAAAGVSKVKLLFLQAQ